MRNVVVLENPMSEDESILRPTLMGSLLDAARNNLAHGAERVALFDSGTVYLAGADDGLAREHHALGVLLAGPLTPPSWRSSQPPAADFFTAKALATAVLDTLRVHWDVRPSDAWAFLHPGRAAEV